MSEEISTTPLRKPPKKALGRGLGSLLGEATVTEVPPPNTGASPKNENAVASVPTVSERGENFSSAQGQKIWQMPIEKLRPNSEQPRQQFAAEKLKELAASIKEKGI